MILTVSHEGREAAEGFHKIKEHLFLELYQVLLASKGLLTDVPWTINS